MTSGASHSRAALSATASKTGLEVGRRTRDHPQDLARRRLLLQRFAHLRVGLHERPVLLLEFRKQADVLDGDHHLIGEGLDQFNLSRSVKAPASPHVTMTAPIRLAGPQHGRSKDRKPGP